VTHVLPPPLASYEAGTGSSTVQDKTISAASGVGRSDRYLGDSFIDATVP
jgi:hypothetical protein